MSDDRKTLIVAEAGVNHNGDIELAKRLVDAASAAGSDFVKFQTFNADRLATEYAEKAVYQIEAGDEHQSQVEMLRQLELSSDMHKVLLAHSRKKNIGFLSSGFDIENLDYLVSLGVECLKLPSGEITNLPYLRHAGAFGLPVILSTGMATMGEVELALQALESSGMERTKITVLHCNTQYPTPMHDVNLLAMCTIRETFGVKVGYSDHTKGIEVPVAAVALGATLIEKHLTLDCKLPGPDHKASIEPDAFAEMVSSIRNIERAMGDGIKRPSASEVENKLIARKSLVASKPISVGEQFTAENITSKRPGTGLSPMRWDEVIGKVAVRDFAVNELISL